MVHRFFQFITLISLFAIRTAGAQVSPEANLLSQFTTLGPVEIEPVNVSRSVAIVQDRRGFLWFGGNGELTRYDGLSYIPYRYDIADSTSISSNWTESFYVGQDGTLWVGTTGGGLNRYDESTDSFTRFQHNPDDPTSLSNDAVKTVLEDSQGVLWVGTHDGLNRYDEETGTFTHYQHDPNDPTSLSNDQVHVLYEDRQGTLWVGTGSPDPGETPVGEGGLNRFDPETKTFTRYLHNPRDDASLINNAVMSLYEDSKGIFWVGTMGDGLHSMDRENGTFTRHRYDPNDRTKLSRPFLEGTEMDESCISWTCGGVTFIYEDSQGMLWIGAFGGGINRYDRSLSPNGSLETGAMSHHVLGSEPFDNYIWTITESRDGTLWVGTWGKAFKISASINLFHHVRFDPTESSGLSGPWVTSLYEDRDGTFWVGAAGWDALLGNALNRYNRSTGTFTHYRHDPQDPHSLGSSNIWGLYEDRNGAFWVSTQEGGLNRFDRETERSTRFPSDPDHPNGLGAAILSFEDRLGRFWVGTYGHGLDLFDPETGRAVHHRHDPDDPESLSNNFIISKLEDRAGALWIGTESGLNRLIEGELTTSFATYLPGLSISALYEDEAGRFWVGTIGDGLYKLDRETGNLTRYGSEEGLFSTGIAGLLEDDNGYLWMSEISYRHGKLSRFNPALETFDNFDSQDGLPDIGFSRNAAMKSRDGRLFFGGHGGFTAFDPKSISTYVRSIPEITLTALYVSNGEVVPGPESPLREPIHQAEEIRLTAEQNDFMIDYSAFFYRDAGRTQYQYRLEDYEKRWLDARTLRSARYSNVPPGSYVFRVRATNLVGIQSEEATIGVVILPPWWRTTMAYIVYGLLIAMGLFTVDRFQRRRLIARERLRAEREKAKAIESTNNELQRALKHLTETQDQLVHTEKMASLGQLTAGIAHEIKNPLNFVNNFAQIASDQAEEIGAVLEEEKEGLSTKGAHELKSMLDDLKLNAQKINEHGQRADGIIRSMLEHSRTERGKRRPVDINKLVDEYVNLAYHGIKAREDGFNVALNRNYDQAVGEVEIYPQEIGRVMINLLDNAFYAVDEKRLLVNGQYTPSVSVDTKKSDGQVKICISDNGMGITEDIQEKIFEPFFTTKPAGSGTGLGLSLSYDIVVKGHGGNLKVESEEGEGSKFEITLLYGDMTAR